MAWRSCTAVLTCCNWSGEGCCTPSSFCTAAADTAFSGCCSTASNAPKGRAAEQGSFTQDGKRPCALHNQQLQYMSNTLAAQSRFKHQPVLFSEEYRASELQDTLCIHAGGMFNSLVLVCKQVNVALPCRGECLMVCTSSNVLRSDHRQVHTQATGSRMYCFL